MKEDYSLIFTVINKGYSDELMEAAREVGARGGTVINARGTGTLEVQKIFGISIQPEKEIVLILAQNAQRQAIMKSIYKAVGLETEGSGFSFSLPVEDILGTTEMMKNLAAANTPEAIDN